MQKGVYIMFKKLIAEFFATFILVLVGCGVAIGVGCADSGGIVATAAAFGLSIVILAYSFGQISGGHANPAVSLAMAIRGDITWKEFGFYCLAQVLGAFTASGLLAFIFWGVKSTGSNSLQGIMNILGNTEVNFSDVTFGLVAEIVLTFIFIFVILGVTNKKEWGGVAGIVIGLSLFGVHLVGIPLTGTSVNPARALSALVLHMFNGSDVIKMDLMTMIAVIIGPFIGAYLAAVLWKGLKVNKKEVEAE